MCRYPLLGCWISGLVECLCDAGEGDLGLPVEDERGFYERAVSYEEMITSESWLKLFM